MKLVTYYRTWPIPLAAVAHLADGQFLQEEQIIIIIIIIIIITETVVDLVIAC
jgi:hypothetical protein